MNDTKTSELDEEKGPHTVQEKDIKHMNQNRRKRD